VKSRPLKIGVNDASSDALSSRVASSAGDLADEDVAPADLAAVGLQLDRAARPERLLAIPEVLHRGVIHDEGAVQMDGRLVADLQDAEGVPFTERFVGPHERVFARRAGAVVPQPARTLAGAQGPLAALLREVPDLHLRVAAKIDPAVGLRDGPVLDEQFDVAEVAVGRGKGALSIVDEFPVLHPPVRAERLVVRPSLGRALIVAHRAQRARIEVLEAVPPGEVTPVEERRESGRRRRRRRQSAGGRQDRQRDEEGNESYDQ
jgi:hypothetical protein